MGSTAIQLENAGFSFPGNSPLLSNVCWVTIEYSKSVLIGPSGCGKSILLKILCGLFKLTEGSYRLFGIEGKAAFAKVAMTFQRSGLFDSYSVYENLDFPLRELTKLSKKERQEKIEWILSEVGLIQQKLLFPHEISGGMQKRLGIARALILSPRLLLCDDPTAGLDPITSSQILDLILKLVEETKSTLVVSTSDLLVARKLSGVGASLHFLYNGKLNHFPDWNALWNTESLAERQFARGEASGPLTEII